MLCTIRRHPGFAGALLALALARPAPCAAGDGPAPGGANRLTVERIFGGPSLTGSGVPLASWRPGHDAWVEWRGAGAQRALWSVDAASGQATKLVALSEFDAGNPADERRTPVEMRGIGRSGPPDHVWAPDGMGVFLALRGDLFHADLATGARRRLTRTGSPLSDVRVAPDGRHVSFCRDHDLHAVAIEADGPHETRLTSGGSETMRHGSLDWLYPEELDATTAAWWSPDSTRVAFLRLDETRVPRFPIADPVPLHGAVREELYPKAGDPNPVPSVGVVGLDGKPPVWLDLGKDPDVYVPWAAWWPDGSRVAVAVLDRSQTRFDLRLCDAAGGAATVLWHEEDPRWVDVPAPPRFLATRPSFLWRSRRDGWWRIWAVPFDGSAPRPITPAGSEVGAILAVDETTGAVFYEARTEDRLRTAVFRTSIDGGTPTRVTDDDGSHAARFASTGRWFLDTVSRATTPPRTTLRRADGSAVRLLADESTAAYAALALRPPEFFTVPGADGTPLSAMLWKPRDFDPSRRYPVVVHVYGGPGSSMVHDAFGAGGGHFSALLAQEGFLVFSVDGHGTGGRGKDFEASVHRRLGTLELADTVAGVRALAKEPWVDPARVGVWGWSYGGTLASYAIARAPGTFRVSVAVAPVTDWRLYDTIYTERYMDRPDENPAGYREAAPLTFAGDVRGALLLCHGLSDDNVHAQNTLCMAEALVHAGRSFDLMIYPQRAHGIEGQEEHVHLFRRILDHFRRNL